MTNGNSLRHHVGGCRSVAPMMDWMQTAKRMIGNRTPWTIPLHQEIDVEELNVPADPGDGLGGAADRRQGAPKDWQASHLLSPASHRK